MSQRQQTGARTFFRENYLLEYYTAKKDVILSSYDYLSPFFEKIYSSRPKKRYVDFNQGIDSRLITDENMKKLAEIPVKPVRIAFDHWELHEIYEKSVRTAVRNGHTSLSNYILYNFKDKPEELYWRLKLNVDLCEELGASIYSFPMKYHPIEDPDYFSNRPANKSQPLKLKKQKKFSERKKDTTKRLPEQPKKFLAGRQP